MYITFALIFTESDIISTYERDALFSAMKNVILMNKRDATGPEMTAFQRTEEHPDTVA